MKGTVQFDSPPDYTEKAISSWSGGSAYHHQIKAKQLAAASAQGFQNHLELRLGISSAADSFSDTVAVTAGYNADTLGNISASSSSCCSYLASNFRHPPEEIALHHNKSILAGNRSAAVTGEHAYRRNGAKHHRRQLSSCRDQPPLLPNELALHQNKSSEFNLDDHQSRSGVDDGLYFDPRMPSGFIHPWSLAARQSKAVIEKAHRNHSNHSSSPVPRVSGPPTLPPVIGWPPVCAFRKNLVHQDPFKLEMQTDNSKRMRDLMEAEGMIHTDAGKATMFVKVNMEGYCIGRKIDLKMHQNYDSLHHALLKLCRNFLSNSYLSESDRVEENETPNVVFLYEDYEGDRMLVGDVPWRLFINSVRRLYIAHCSENSTDHDHGSEADNPENK